MADGYLAMDEFDERSDRLLRARTAGELAVLQQDLPVTRIVPPAQPRPDEIARPHGSDVRNRRCAAVGHGLPAYVGSYLGTMALLIGIWLVVGLAAGAWYFWPIWPMLGWGVCVARRAVPGLAGGHGRGGRRVSAS